MFILKMYKIINFYFKFKIEMDRKKLNKILVRHLMSTKKVMDNSMYIIFFTLYVTCVCLHLRLGKPRNLQRPYSFSHIFSLVVCLVLKQCCLRGQSTELLNDHLFAKELLIRFYAACHS